MLVIADSSPIIVLIKIGHLKILPAMYGEIVIPPAVADELGSTSRPQAVKEFIASPPSWLRVVKPKHVKPIPPLHPGETEALTLAQELHAELLLVDERNAYREAVARKINAIGTVRALEQAAEQGLLDLKEAFDRVKQTDFWISQDLLDGRLRLFQQRQKL